MAPRSDCQAFYTIYAILQIYQQTRGHEYCTPGAASAAETYFMLFIGMVALGAAGIGYFYVLDCLKRGTSRLHVLQPVNLLAYENDRYLYCAVFGMATYSIFNIILSSSTDLGKGPELNWFVRQLLILSVAVEFYSLVTAISSRHLSGYAFGIVNAGAFLALSIYGDVVVSAKYCFRTDMSYEVYVFVQLLENLPPFLLSIVVIATLTAKSAYQLKQRSRVDVEKPLNSLAMPRHHMKYVQLLINSNRISLKTQESQLEIKKIIKSGAVHGIKYSTGYMIGMTASLVWAYKICFLPLDFGQVFDLVDELHAIFPKIPALTFVRSVHSAMYVTLYLTIGITVFGVFNAARQYQRDLLNLMKGRVKLRSSSTRPASVTRSASLFLGYHIAYFLWGSLILGAAVMLLSGALAVFICALTQYPSLLRRFLKLVRSAAAALVLGLILPWTVQMLLVHFYFCDKMEKDGKQIRVLSIKNRRSFANYQYFMVFLNAGMGAFSVLRRALFGLVFGLLFLVRLDRSTLPYWCERFDSGHQAYVNFLTVEHVFRNPIVHVFLHLLRSSKTVGVQAMGNGVSDAKPALRRSKRMKWLVAYTLLNNPSIIVERKQKLKAVML